MTERQSMWEKLRVVFLKRSFAFFMLASACVLTLAIVLSHVNVITIHDGEQEQQILTLTSDPDRILLEAGVSLSADDLVESGQTGAHSGEITILRGEPAPEASVDPEPVTVSYYGLLARYENSETANVEYKTVETLQEIPFKTVQRSTNSLLKGTTKVGTKGKPGIQATVYKQKLVDGRIVESVLEGDVVKEEPVDQVVLVGSYVPAAVIAPVATGEGLTSADVPCISKISPASPIPLDENGHPVSYARVITGSATAYNGPGKYTASGRPAMEGHVAVDPRVIPYGTRLYIVSADGKYNYGYAIAADTGGFIYSGNTVVDLFFSSYNDCCRFGRRNVVMYVLN